MGRKAIDCKGLPPAIGAYSQGVWAGNLLFLSGVCGEDPATGELVEGGIGAETKQAMEAAGAMLESEGLTFDDVVSARIYISDFDDFKAMNEVYKSFFTPPYPARATVEVGRLADGAKVEIVLVAYKEA